MQNLPSPMAGRSRVTARGEHWLVIRHEPFAECALITLRGAGNDNRGRTLQLLTPFDRVSLAPHTDRIRRRARRGVLRDAALAIARAHDWTEPWTALSAGIDLYPWQLEPAMAAIAGATRLLLTDGVGLGKTIQAGLILSELRVRGLVSRALVLTPASLRYQWQDELAARFAMPAVVMDHEAVVRAARELPIGVNPWSTADTLISSIDLVKRGEVRRALDSVPIDILIVDEAHHVTPATDRGAVVADLATRSTWVVLATATPHSGDTNAFAFLSALGGDTGQPAICFQRRRRHVGVGASRRVHLHPVGATRDEKALLDEVTAYAQALWHGGRAPQRGGRIVASIICRRAVSSSRALIRTLSRRRLLIADDFPPPPVEPQLPWLEAEDDGLGSDSLLGAAPMPDNRVEREWLDRLIERAERCERSAKFETLERLLSRTTEAAVVFSEYRDTLDDVEKRLAGRFTLAVLHGGLSSRERRDAIAQFIDGRVRVLLASDAAGEGLNLQARCRLVINVELPWNPVRLEQRIGRVDRLGQRRRVHAVHLYHRDSFEDHVLARLQRRVARAEEDLRGAGLSEDAIAAVVFGEAVLPQPAVAMSAPPPARARESCPTSLGLRARVRALATSAALEHRRRGAGCAGLGSRRRARAMALLYEWDIRDGEMRVVARQLACVEVTFKVQRFVPRSQLRRLTCALAACRPVRSAVSRAQEAARERTERTTVTTARALDARLRSIARALEAKAPAEFQASLFDRRAEQQARAARGAIETVMGHVARQIESARALETVTGTEPPRLVAAWLLPAEARR